MKKWIIVIFLSAALLCLCALMAGISWLSFRQIGRSGEVFRPVLAMAEATEEKTLEVNAPAALDVRISHGDITIKAAEADTITIGMHKIAHAESQAKAEEELKTMQVKITQNGASVKVVFEQPKDTSMNLDLVQSDQVDLTILVPAETAVTAFSGSGDVSLNGTRGEASISSDYGNLYASVISGSLSASTSSGMVEASDIQAGQADIDLKSDYGNITLKTSSAQAVKASASSGTLELVAVAADSQVTLHSDYGNIWVADVDTETLTVTSSSGRIDLTNLEISADLKVKSDYGDLHLDRVAAGSTDLESSSGTVTIEGVGGMIKAHSDYGNVKVTGGKAVTLALSAINGPVEYSGALGAGPHTLHSDYGNLTITIPADTGLAVDLKTNYGDIKSAIPVTFNGDIDPQHWVGSLNGGGESLTASTSSGNIRIEVLNP